MMSNCMKLFNQLDQVDDITLRKLITVEIRGRKRLDMVDRLRTTLDTRRKLREKAQLQEATEQVRLIVEGI